ncbi:unnamed protein product [Camellia sinensis]
MFCTIMANLAAHHPAEVVAVTVTEEKSQLKQEDNGTKQMGNQKGIQIKFVILPLTILSFLLSLPVLFSFIWLLYIKQYDCEDLLKLPKLQIGIVIGLIAVFLVSNIVVYMRAKVPVPGLLLVMVPLIMMLTVGLGLVGAYNMESRTVPGSSVWLKSKVHNEINWYNIKSCLYHSKTCEDLVSRSRKLKADVYTTSKLSYIEAGCCRPPVSCNMEYINATYWRKEEEEELLLDSSIPYNRDCDLWTNKENVLCYNCNACREGFLKTLQGKWWKLGMFLVVMSFLLILSHLLLFVITMWEQHG